MIDIAICNDERDVVDDIERRIMSLSKKFLVDINIDIFYDGKTLIEDIFGGNKYDVIYLDIEIKKENGVDIAKKIRIIDKNTLLVYIADNENFIKEAFEVEAFRFIKKPIDSEIFERYFFNIKDKLYRNPYYFQYKRNKVNYKVPLKDIIYFQSDKRVTYIVTQSQCWSYYEKLNNIEKNLNNVNIYFYRIHQSFLVNPYYVSSYAYSMMKLNDGTTLTVSEKRRKKISEVYYR